MHAGASWYNSYVDDVLRLSRIICYILTVTAAAVLYTDCQQQSYVLPRFAAIIRLPILTNCVIYKNEMKVLITTLHVGFMKIQYIYVRLSNKL